jgi:hypothetical protein
LSKSTLSTLLIAVITIDVDAKADANAVAILIVCSCFSIVAAFIVIGAIIITSEGAM